MNYVFLSPSFPPNFKQFAIRLNEMGINVLGIGSDSYYSMEPDLRNALTEYYKVDQMEDYHQLHKACAFLTFKHGKLDRIESHNEHWLAYDARLRQDFNVFGLKPDEVKTIQSKSKMKKIFSSNGIPHARGKIARNINEGRVLVQELGFPVIAKPDYGVGASQTHKFNNEAELEAFFRVKADIDFIFEEFIDGQIVTFDGFTDMEENIVQASSMTYLTGVMNIVNENLDSIFTVERIIPEDLIEIGTKTLRSFPLKERFFHIEFFRLKDGSLIALEINIRPPGGLCLDVSNFSSDSDIYRQYAMVVAGKTPESISEKPYYSTFVGLKLHPVPPVHTVEDYRSALGPMLVYSAANPPLFAQAMGDYAVILRHPDRDELVKGVEFVIER